MNIINIAMKEIKRDFRDIQTFVFMLAFPIVLMLILGTALSNAFSTQISIGKVHVLYKDQSKGDISTYFKAFSTVAGKSGIDFKKAGEKTDGKREVKDGHYDSYLEILDNGIQLYESGRNSIEASIVEGMLVSFKDKYNLAAVVEKVAPGQIPVVLSNSSSDNYIKEVSLQSERQPGSMDYYAITMTTLIALYAAMGGIQLFHGERVGNTANRLMAAPITKGEIFLGKIVGSLVTNSICTLLVVLFSKYILHANWGDHLGLVFLVLLSEVFLAISFGLGTSYIVRTGAASKMIVMVVVNVAAFAGGAYYKLSDTSGISSLSPLTWINTALTKIIYGNEWSAAIPAIALNLGISALFLLIAVLALQRREGL